MEKKSCGIANWDESLQWRVESVKMCAGRSLHFFFFFCSRGNRSGALLARDAIYAFQKAGLDSEATKLRRAIQRGRAAIPDTVALAISGFALQPSSFRTTSALVHLPEDRKIPSGWSVQKLWKLPGSLPPKCQKPLCKLHSCEQVGLLPSPLPPRDRTLRL